MKVVKEFIILLLVCLITMLLLAVIFYNYLPARKIIPEVATYKASDTVTELLADNIDNTDNDVLLTYEGGEYEVTKSDLKNYESVKKYVPGKSNPFAKVATDNNSNTNSSNGSGTATKGDATNDNSNNTKDNKPTNTNGKNSSSTEDKNYEGTKEKNTDGK